MSPEDGFERLVARAKQDVAVEQNARDVMAKYGPMFTPQGISTLDPAKFRAFLTYNENRHWTGIHRHSGDLTADLPRLQKALRDLLDESEPIASRIDEARRTMGGAGLGRAVISAILIVAYPEKYGVYNRKSELGLRKIGRYPGDTDPGFDNLSTGKQYERVNEVLNELSAKHGISLWALDWVLGDLATGGGPEPPSPTREGFTPDEEVGSGSVAGGRFQLEKHLEGFLIENWDLTPFSAFMEILTNEEGEPVGEQYRTDVGVIDLLCKNKDESGYTVVELKLGRAGDGAIGQLTGYMGEIQRTLAKDGKSVRGVIICEYADPRLISSRRVVPNVDVYTYKIGFSLSKKE
jgi:hypothetical protein